MQIIVLMRMHQTSHGRLNLQPPGLKSCSFNRAFKGINRKYIGQINIIIYSTGYLNLALYGRWGRIRGRKRLVQGPLRVCPPGKPILRKSISTGKTAEIHHTTIFVQILELLLGPKRCATQFGAGCTDREPEIYFLDMFRDGFLFGS